MKNIIPFLALLFSCGETATPETEPSFIDTTSQIATTAISQEPSEPKEITDTLRNPYHESYLTDLPLRKVGQLILADSVMPLDNGVTFKCMDSILSDHITTRDFFFPVFLKILDKADGALSEVVCLFTKNYIERFPKEFSRRYAYFTNTQIDQWAFYTRYELGFVYDNKAKAESWMTSIIKKCTSCDSTDIKHLADFGELAIKQSDELNENGSL